MNIPDITVNEMREVDRIMIKEMKISLLQMMENAGRILARIIINEFPNANKILVLVGKGNNGGGGLVCARYLHNFGKKVSVILTSNDLPATSKRHLHTLKQLNVPITKDLIGKPDLVVDALLGYNAKGEPKGKIADLVKKTFLLPVISLDAPTGFDLSTGKWFRDSYRNAVVVTLGLPKKYMKMKKMYVADIGIPKEVFSRIHIKVPTLFQKTDYIKI